MGDMSYHWAVKSHFNLKMAFMKCTVLYYIRVRVRVSPPASIIEPTHRLKLRSPYNIYINQPKTQNNKPAEKKNPFFKKTFREY